MSESEFEDVDERLESMGREISDLNKRCHYRSMMRVANEARRLARVEQRLMPYLDACFHVMNDSRHVLNPTEGREVAIELITLLESEDRARQFQPNLSEDDYERTKWWMTACAYDNLAVNTASSNGYNSEGMHQCIADGIQVCRRTGKLQCITCFREYGTDVYIAADDLDMALHHARVGISHQDPGPHDRRHVGAKDAVRILLLGGQLEAAIEMLDLAWKLSDGYHSPYAGKLDTYTYAIELYHLAGCPERLDALPKLLSAEEGKNYEGPADDCLIEPPRDEFPSYFLERDLADSLVACCQGEFDTATKLLQPWDVLLRENKCQGKWFEVRLRLVAIARLTGKMTQAQALAKQMRIAAQDSRDWLTLRRLERLLDESIPATPLALAGPVRIGPYAVSVPEVIPVESSSQHNASEADDSQEPTVERSPIAEAAFGFFRRLMESGGDDEKLAAITSEILAIAPSTVLQPDDAAQLLHLVRFVATAPERVQYAWTWAEALFDRYSQDARVISMFASLGAMFASMPGSELRDVVTQERLERLFRQSLDLDPNAHDNFARAGAFYLSQDNLGEAERCLARGFRLSRSSAYLAERLADIYSRTDRPRDALAVLDMCLREGCDDPDVAWEAVTAANHLEQYEAVLTYLDRFDELRPDQPWTNHYRACALLELDRPAEALEALAREEMFNSELTFHVSIVGTSCLASMKRVEEFRAGLELVLATPLSSVDYLTMTGLQRLFTRLWTSSSTCVPAGDPSLEQLEQRLLEAGLAPNEMFAAHRMCSGEESKQADLKFYHCRISQPLDDRWATFPGRLVNEADWTGYEISWGVLASSDEQAEELVLAWQKRCFPLDAVILEIEENGDDFTDAVGVVWQGYREGTFPDGEPS